MTSSPLPLEAPKFSGDPGHFETKSTKLVTLPFDVFRVAGGADVDATILPSRSVGGLRLHGLHQPRRGSADRAPSEENERPLARPKPGCRRSDLNRRPRAYESGPRDVTTNQFAHLHTSGPADDVPKSALTSPSWQKPMAKIQLLDRELAEVMLGVALRGMAERIASMSP